MAFASNKIEALAIGKALGVFAIFSLGVLLDFPIRLFAMIVPSYWVGEILYLNDGLFIFRALTGILCHSVWLVVLLLIFKNKVE